MTVSNMYTLKNRKIKPMASLYLAMNSFKIIIILYNKFIIIIGTKFLFPVLLQKTEGL
ncbi:hypothetical protein NBRC110019_05000 [Neptunitalea chrysea]|uniref:Uncharacterized protein n=1 Tax=Neptunitalea chrysea TaxID=1647581 RepID=A0A9W6B318_9FLAO|nr:hypothetical protein NBRC110019_05000 [Neptunitalea chrysea]